MQPNKIINNINIIMPRPLISTTSLGVLIPRTITRVCSKIQYPSFNMIIKPQMIDRNHFHGNNALTDSLLKAFYTLQTKTENDSTTVDVKKPLKLKTSSNKEFETSLTENSKLNDFSEETLIEELKKRELVKTDLGNTAVKIKLSDNSEYVLGGPKNGIKLSPLGQAYYNNIKSKDNENNSEESFIKPNIEHENSQLKFIIIVPPSNSTDLFIETGKQKHMLVVVDENNNYYSLGYFTSKHTIDLLSPQQFKSFQDLQEKVSFEYKNKPQFLRPFKNLVKINKEDILRVKWDENYIQTLTADSIKLLKDYYIDLCKKPYEIFDKFGLTKEDCLNMCIEHDKVAQKKGAKHPLTEDQRKKNDINKYAQKNNKKQQSSDDVKEN